MPAREFLIMTPVSLFITFNVYCYFVPETALHFDHQVSLSDVKLTYIYHNSCWCGEWLKNLHIERFWQWSEKSIVMMQQLGLRKYP